MLRSERAQEFEPFRMLIAAVFALAVLVIIIGAINYFDGLRVDVSRQRFMDGLGNAVKQPNGRPLQISGVQLQRGAEYTSLSLSKQVNLPPDCMVFDDAKSAAFTVSNGKVAVNENVLSDVLVQCSSNIGAASPAWLPSDCEVACQVTFSEAQQ